MCIKSPLRVLLLRDVSADLKNAPTEVCSITVDSGSIWHRSSRLKHAKFSTSVAHRILFLHLRRRNEQHFR